MTPIDVARLTREIRQLETDRATSEGAWLYAFDVVIPKLNAENARLLVVAKHARAYLESSTAVLKGTPAPMYHDADALRARSQTIVAYCGPCATAFSSMPRSRLKRSPLVSRPRATARSMRCQASSHVTRRIRAALWTSVARSTSIASRSNKTVNRDRGSAHATRTCLTPCVGHRTRGTRAWREVRN